MRTPFLPNIMKTLSLVAFLLLFFSGPSLAFAQAIVPCGTDENHDGIVKNYVGQDGNPVEEECTFKSVIDLAKNIIGAWIGATVIVATMGFAYAGYLYITAMGSEEKIKHAHSIFTKTLLGFVFVLGAWLIAVAFEQTFLSPESQRRSFLESCPAGQVLVEGTCVNR